MPARAREAAIALVVRSAERTKTSGVQLLSDLYDIFESAEKLATETILDRLHKIPESAWVEIYGKPLNDRGLATRLRKYGVQPKVVRIGDSTPRGYVAADLLDPWKRYVFPSRQEAQQAQQRNTQHLETESATAAVTETNGKGGSRCGVADVADFPRGQGTVADADPFACLKDASLKLRRENDDCRDLPDFLDRRPRLNSAPLKWNADG